MLTFPVDPVSKVPDGPWKELTSSLPVPVGRGTGLATGARSGLLVVDLDVKRGIDGPTNFDALGDWPDTFAVKTPSGGLHLYFAEVPGARNSAGKLAPGVDIRAEGGYVLAPPSPGYVVASHAPVAPAPPWLVAALTERTPWQGMARASVQGATIIEGSRNDALARLAGKMRRGGFEPDAIAAALQSHNASHCDPPLEPEEVELIASSVGRYEPSAPVTAAPRAPIVSGDRKVEWSASEIAGEIPAVDYVVERVDFCAGAPMMIAGYGFSGKTIAAQALALGLACPTPALGVRMVWGDLRARTKPCRVVHVDWEQGPNLTRRRYQRLARGMGIDLRACGLTLVSLPDLYLDQPGAFDALATTLEGVDVAIFDSLRALAPSIEENSSEFRAPLDGLLRVSNATGCACVVIHHARKPSKDSAGGVKMQIRGSGAIFDACGSVLVFDGAKGAPTRVFHEKARESGVTCDDFSLKVEDVNGGIVVRAEGLTVETAEQTGSRQIDETKARILEMAGTAPIVSRDAMRARLGVGSALAKAAFDELAAGGAIINLGSSRAPRWAPA